MQAFIVSLVAGLLFPLIPIIAEYGTTVPQTGVEMVRLEVWAVTSVVFIAAIGMMSRHQAVLVTAFFFSALDAIIYGTSRVPALKEAAFVKNGPTICAVMFGVYGFAYVVERLGRHVIEGQPFLEIDI